MNEDKARTRRLREEADRMAAEYRAARGWDISGQDIRDIWSEYQGRVTGVVGGFVSAADLRVVASRHS